jgi:hypothetical protein
VLDQDFERIGYEAERISLAGIDELKPSVERSAENSLWRAEGSEQPPRACPPDSRRLRQTQPYSEFAPLEHASATDQAAL